MLSRKEKRDCFERYIPQNLDRIRHRGSDSLFILWR